MPQVELTRGEYGLEGVIRLPAWEHWQIQEQAQPIRVERQYRALPVPFRFEKF